MDLLIRTIMDWLSLEGATNINIDSQSDTITAKFSKTHIVQYKPSDFELIVGGDGVIELRYRREEVFNTTRWADRVISTIDVSKVYTEEGEEEWVETTNER